MKNKKYKKNKDYFLNSFSEFFKKFGLIEIREVENLYLILIFNKYNFTLNKFIGKYLKKYFKYYKNLPLILTKEFINNAKDVYGASLFYIKNFSKTIFGINSFDSFDLNKDSIRIEIEKELRSKLFNVINYGIEIKSKKKLYNIILKTLENINYLVVGILYLIGIDYSNDFLINLENIVKFYDIEAGKSLINYVKKGVKNYNIEDILLNLYNFLNYLILKVDKI